MDQLLRDGGDLDSMDRSLIDYNLSKGLNVGTSGGNVNNLNGHKADSPPLPAPPSNNLTVGLGGASISVSPATPIPSPITSPEVVFLIRF